MVMGEYEKSKFRFSETFNNSTGKTSGSGFIGVIMGIIAIASFISVLVGWWLNKANVLEMIDKVLQLALLSTALLGVRRFSGKINGVDQKNKAIELENEEKQEN